MFFTHFEFKHKEHMLNKKDNVRSSPQTRDSVFKIDLGDALDVGRKINFFKNFDLLLPGIVLIQLDTSTRMLGQFAENLFWAGGSEPIQRIRIEPAAKNR